MTNGVFLTQGQPMYMVHTYINDETIPQELEEKMVFCS